MKNNILSRTIIALLGGILLFLCAMFGLAIFKESKTRKEIASKSHAIDNLARKIKMPLTEQSIVFLTDERNKLKSVYSRLKLALISPLAEEIPAEGLDSLQFKERLIQTQKKLREDAREFSLALPERLGFAKYETELSQPGEIPALSRRLVVLEEIIHLMTLSGIASLEEINFIGRNTIMEASDIMPQKEDLYDEVRTNFRLTCTYSALIDFLYKLRVSPFMFVVEDLDIARTKDERDKDEERESMLQANFLVKAEIIR